jgi:hypothetical protein
MMEEARRGTKRVVLVKEEYNERSETGAFSELKTSLALPRQGMIHTCGVNTKLVSIAVEMKKAAPIQLVHAPPVSRQVTVYPYTVIGNVTGTTSDGCLATYFPRLSTA